ncbi:MAG: acyl carrier protein [Bacteroidetes bacterium]|nr:acyl carrier protein [Bacteroidota bacterium]
MSALTSKKSDITARVRNIIHEKLGVDESALVETASFSTDLGLDSLDVLEAFMEMEKAFSIRISDEEAEKLTTVGSVIDYITSHTR